jgi:hypothetical protein
MASNHKSQHCRAAFDAAHDISGLETVDGARGWCQAARHVKASQSKHLKRLIDGNLVLKMAVLTTDWKEEEQARYVYSIRHRSIIRSYCRIVDAFYRSIRPGWHDPRDAMM